MKREWLRVACKFVAAVSAYLSMSRTVIISGESTLPYLVGTFGEAFSASEHGPFLATCGCARSQFHSNSIVLDASLKLLCTKASQGKMNLIACGCSECAVVSLVQVKLLTRSLLAVFQGTLLKKRIVTASKNH